MPIKTIGRDDMKYIKRDPIIESEKKDARKKC
jgi:hypothetical protein